MRRAGWSRLPGPARIYEHNETGAQINLDEYKPIGDTLTTVHRHLRRLRALPNDDGSLPLRGETIE
jgi:hypothetical protein